MKDQIERLGFQAWADNLIADALENIAAAPRDFDDERSEATIVGRIIGGKMTVAVRAYVPGLGWQTTDRTTKLPLRK